MKFKKMTRKIKQFWHEMDPNDKLGVVVLLIAIGLVALAGTFLSTREDKTVVMDVPYYDCSNVDNQEMSEWIEKCYMSNWNSMNWCKDHASKLFCETRTRRQWIKVSL